MHLVDKFYCDLTRMMEYQKEDVLGSLRREEVKRRDEVDAIIQEIAKKEIEYQKNSVKTISASWLPKIEKEDFAFPVLLITTCFLDTIVPESMQFIVHCGIGAVVGSYSVSQEVKKERVRLEKEKEELAQERLKFERDRFELDEKQLNFMLGIKKINHKEALDRLNAEEAKEAYIEMIKDCLV